MRDVRYRRGKGEILHHAGMILKEILQNFSTPLFYLGSDKQRPWKRVSKREP
jgi:hypothetical protein